MPTKMTKRQWRRVGVATEYVRWHGRKMLKAVAREYERWDRFRVKLVRRIARATRRAPLGGVKARTLALVAWMHSPKHAFGPGFTTRQMMQQIVRRLIRAGELARVGKVVTWNGRKNGVQSVTTVSSLCRIGNGVARLNAA